MRNQERRIVIDTNLWISFLISPINSRIPEVLSDNSISILMSDELLDEILIVALRAKFSRFIAKKAIDELLLILVKRCLRITVRSTIQCNEDPKDAFLFSLCADGKAQCLLTGDKTLLKSKSFRSTEILSITSFLEHRR
jgi:putative PIN family toxin of toxin-antitoxin system